MVTHNYSLVINYCLKNWNNSRVAFRGREGAFALLKTGWPPWAMLCVLLLILFLKDS